jgi:hypothetical protein
LLMSYSWLTDVNIILYYIGSLDDHDRKEAVINITNVVSVVCAVRFEGSPPYDELFQYVAT